MEVRTDIQSFLLSKKQEIFLMTGKMEPSQVLLMCFVTLWQVPVHPKGSGTVRAQEFWQQYKLLKTQSEHTSIQDVLVDGLVLQILFWPVQDLVQNN